MDDVGEGCDCSVDGDEVGLVIVARTSKYMDKARPITSKPGPGFDIREVFAIAIEEGILMTTDIGRGAWYP